MIYDYKLNDKAIYLPKAEPEIIVIPKMSYILIEGEGSPDASEFSERVEALYAIAYAIRMSYKTENVPKGYFEFKVFPLEGIWDLIDYSKGAEDKRNYKYTLMIRQPEFVDLAVFDYYKNVAAKKKKTNSFISEVGFRALEEGSCCQMMHIGPFAEESKSFEIMETAVKNLGFERKSKLHKEIYLSDPRKTAPEKMKTVLRFEVIHPQK
ncbi:MAG: hypothetical protein BGO41_12540 [Clostridiales bacterium 38-18]|nr:MAG: hypothetical protein BGO41_12540 [Clostridiales bacterium 38-18]